MATQGNQDYIAKTGEAAEARLKVLHSIYSESTLNFYRRTGLKSAMEVLEIGCGAGYVTIEIAKLVGPNGRVFAIDISEQQLATAKKNAEIAQVNNITFIQCDIHQLETLGLQFDFIACRFVLMHIKNPEQAIHTLYKVLKPAGKMALEETEMSKSFSNPASKSFDNSIAWLMAYADQLGLDFDLGMKLFPMVRKLPCCHAKLVLSQQVIITPFDKQLFPMNARECADKYIEYNIASAEQIEQAACQMEQENKSDAVFYGAPLIHQVSCQKPAAT